MSDYLSKYSQHSDKPVISKEEYERRVKSMKTITQAFKTLSPEPITKETRLKKKEVSAEEKKKRRKAREKQKAFLNEKLGDYQLIEQLTNLPVTEEIKQALKNSLKNMDTYSKIFEALEEGIPLGKIFGLNEKSLEAIYDQGYTKFLNAKYKDACAIFQYLCRLSPYTYKYAFAFAAATHKSGDFYQAGPLYQLAGTLEERNPTPFYHAVDCYLHVDDIGSAVACVELALSKSKKHPEFKELEVSCRALRKYLYETYLIKKS